MSEKDRIKPIHIAGCYKCPCFCDCCAPYCGLATDLDWGGGVMHGEDAVHPDCPLRDQLVILSVVEINKEK